MTFYDPGPPPPGASAFAEASADRRSLGGGWSARLFRSNRATIGPWDSGLQHGGPPAALLALHLEALAASKQARIARLSYDFLSPVPVADLSVTTEVIRPGARIQLSSAVLRTADRPVLRATAWHVTAEPGRSTPVTSSFVVPPIPPTETRNYFPGVGSFPYAEAIEWRFVTGGFDQLGPATVWTRCRIPVLDGVALTGLQRLLVVVDAANGISASLPITSWTFVPIDLTVVLERHPIDEWVGMSSVTTIGTDGIGFSETTLFDVRGAIGRALQTLFVAPRVESASSSAPGRPMELVQPIEAAPAADMTAVGATALWMSANRALETECADPLYRDPFARELAGKPGFSMMSTMRAALGVADNANPDLYLTLRTRFLDDAVLAATREGALTQTVILAAGMDARAFRLDWPKGHVIFEVDRREIFDYKEPVLERRGARPSVERRIVRADMLDRWTEALIEQGFDTSRPAAFLMEGLLMYLDPQAADGVLEALGALAAPGSWLGLDVVNPAMLTSLYTAQYMKKLAEVGCPWLFGVEEPESWLAGHGWLATAITPGEPGAHYDRWTFPVIPRTVAGMPRVYLVTASRIPTQQ